MDTTKILVRIRNETLAKFDQSIKDLGLQRDAFLDRVIAVEVRHFEIEMEGKVLPQPTNLYIRRHFKRRINSTPVSIKVRKSTALALEKVLKKTNVPRDSFINRVLMFLNCTEGLLKFLGIPNGMRVQKDVPISPLRAADYVLTDPLFPIREAVREAGNDEGIYLLRFPESLTGLACHLPDASVPGTKEYLEWKAEIDAFMDVEDVGAFGSESLKDILVHKVTETEASHETK